MHGNALNGSGRGTVPVNHPGLVATYDHEGRHPVASTTEEQDHADGQGVRIEEDQRRGDVPPAVGSGSGDDAGRDRGDQSDPLGPAVIDGRDKLDGAGAGDAEHVPGPGGSIEPLSEVQEVAVFRVPPRMVVKALKLGADVGLGAVIQRTGDETADHVFQELVAGRMQLWSIADQGKPVGTMVTQVEGRPATRALVVRYLAGEKMQDWAGEATEALKVFARETGCEGIEAIGREGLRKHLLAIGWSKVAVVYRVPVDG